MLAKTEGRFTGDRAKLLRVANNILAADISIYHDGAFSSFFRTVMSVFLMDTRANVRSNALDLLGISPLSSLLFLSPLSSLSRPACK